MCLLIGLDQEIDITVFDLFYRFPLFHCIRGVPRNIVKAGQYSAGIKGSVIDISSLKAEQVKGFFIGNIIQAAEQTECFLQYGIQQHKGIRQKQSVQNEELLAHRR
jgi:hypothetical protein